MILRRERCAICAGPIVGADDICVACADAPRRVALRRRAADRYCAKVHRGLAAAARARGDVEEADARERRALDLDW